MKAAFVLIALVAGLAVAESLVLRRRRQASVEAEFEQLIQTACVDPLNLTTEEAAAMEKIRQLQENDNISASSEEDLDKLLAQVTSDPEVAESLKPKMMTFVVCVATEFLKALGLAER